MQLLFDIISGIRNIRAHWNIDNAQKIDCFIGCSAQTTLSFLKKYEGVIALLGKIQNLTFQTTLKRPHESAGGVEGKVKFFIPLSGIIDIPKEKERLSKQLSDTSRQIESLANRLQNKEFLKKAPTDVVEKERLRKSDLEQKINELKKILKKSN